jgi:uncharacterized membrane protein YdjX (TVP38/TMEM64 family)
LLAVTAVAATVYAMGWHRYLSLDVLIRERAAIDAFLALHPAWAVAAYLVVYAAVVGFGLPGGALLSIAGGLFFGAIAGGVVGLVGATAGATVIFLITRTAFGAGIARGAGPLAARLSAGFRRDAFHYLLVLRLIPLFPFYLVNLVPALCNISLRTYLAATFLGMVPATFAFATLGAGFDDALRAKGRAYDVCRLIDPSTCSLRFDYAMLMTPRLLIALTMLAAITLLPIIVRKVRARRRAAMLDVAA